MLGKREITRIFVWQFGCSAMSALVLGITLGPDAGAASAAGGSIAMLANLTMALIALSGGPAAANRVMRRFYFAEASKILVTVAALALAFGLFDPPARPLLATFAIALLAHWAALVFVRKPLLSARTGE